jgi:WD40 repeat protein
MDSTPVKRRKPEDLWAAYALGSLNQPRTLAGISQHVHLIAVGLDGTICSTSRGGAVTVLRGGNGGRALSRQMLKIDTDEVYALAVGPDGKVYVGSHESMLTVWSDSLHTQTLHSNSIRSLAVGLDGKIYSGSADNTITVRRPDDFAHLNTLVGHTDAVVALAGTHLRSLMGLTGVASCLAAGIDGKIYSGGSDGQIRVWRGDDGAPLKTIPTVGAEHQITRCKH